MNYILFDDHSWDYLLPLTFTRPVSEIRTGIITIREKWEIRLNKEVSNLTKEYLQYKFPVHFEKDNILINSSLLPSPEALDLILELPHETALFNGNRLLAVRTVESKARAFVEEPALIKIKKNVTDIRMVDRLWHIFSINGEEIRNDFAILTRDRKSASLSKTNNLISPENIFAEEGVRAEHVTINASTGPVYLGPHSEIMEGAVIRGPFALCERAIVKMGAKIYGPTTIGPVSKVGGEINNSVIQGYSNKGHEGFLGNSVLGEWCNIGANTNNSNLKNNYSVVRLWSYPDRAPVLTGLQFCGLIMGDHSKCGINTMFNTGTVVGVNANIFGSGYPDTFIPSFSWGGPGGFTGYSPDKALEVASRVMAQRNMILDEKDKAILLHIYEMEKVNRTQN